MEHPDKTFFFKELLSTKFVPSKLEKICRKYGNQCFIEHNAVKYILYESKIDNAEVVCRIIALNKHMRKFKIEILYGVQMPRIDILFIETGGR